MNVPHEIIRIFPNHLNEEIIHLLISEAAYYKAKRRGFEPGHEEQYWLEAEKEIKSCLRGYFDFSYFH
jgi:DUF2934 family protein